MLQTIVLAVSAGSVLAAPLLEKRQDTPCYAFNTTETLSCVGPCTGDDNDNNFGFNDGYNVAFNEGKNQADVDTSRYSSGAADAGRSRAKLGLPSNYTASVFTTTPTTNNSIVCNSNAAYAAGFKRAYLGEDFNFPVFNGEYSIELNLQLQQFYQAGYDDQTSDPSCFRATPSNISCTNCQGDDNDGNVAFNDAVNEAIVEGTVAGTAFGNSHVDGEYEAGLTAARNKQPSNYIQYAPDVTLIPDPNNSKVCTFNVAYDAGWLRGYTSGDNTYSAYNTAFLAAANVVLSQAYANGYAAGSAVSSVSSTPVGPTAEARLRNRRQRQQAANAPEAS